MFGTYFYHERIRKSVATFGALFNNIYVLRKNASGGILSQVKVPLAYAPQQKFLERIRENPELRGDTSVAIKLPRMSFEIVSMAYDNGRQIARNNNFMIGSNTNTKRNKFNAYAPYIISFQLNVYAKTQDDALQVIEQIFPYFTPQYTLTLKPFSDYSDIKEDVPITLTGVSFNDDFEGALESRRTIIYTLEFDMKINFYGPINSSNVIRKSIANIYDQELGLQDSDLKVETITTVPDPLSIIGLADSDFGFTHTVTYIGDSS